MVNELQTVLNEIKADKDTNLLPENLKKGITCLGVNGNLAPTAKQYSSKTEMFNDLGVAENAIGVVYTSEIKSLKDVRSFDKFNCPDIVILDNAVTNSEYCDLQPDEEHQSGMTRFGISLSNTGCYISYEIESNGFKYGQIEYTSTDGITYTKTSGNSFNELGISFNTNDKITDNINKFLQIPYGNYQGLYQFGKNNSFIKAVTNDNKVVQMLALDDMSGTFVSVLETDNYNYVTKAKIIPYIYYGGFYIDNTDNELKIISHSNFSSLSVQTIDIDNINGTYTITDTLNVPNTNSTSTPVRL